MEQGGPRGYAHEIRGQLANRFDNMANACCIVNCNFQCVCVCCAQLTPKRHGDADVQQTAGSRRDSALTNEDISDT